MNRILKNGCHWDIKWNGVLETGLTDEMLDLFLLQHINDFNIKSSTFYSRTALEETDSKLQQAANDLASASVEVVKSLDDLGEPDQSSYMQIPNSIGVTRAIGELPLNDGSPLVTPMSIKEYKRKKQSEIESGVEFTLPNGKKLQEENSRLHKTAKDLVDMEEESWNKLTKLGTDVHKVFQDIFSGKTPEQGTLSTTIFNSLVSQVNDFKTSLEKKYPGCKFYPEFGIKSKNLSTDMLALLETKGLDSINGVIDLLVIDTNGLAHIYDYKVSRKSIAKSGENNVDWWGISGNITIRDYKLWASAKKLSATYQTEFYKQMLKGYDIRVADTNILPVKLDLKYENSDNPFEVTDVENVELQYGSGQLITNPGLKDGAKSAGKIKKLFSTPAIVSPDDISKISEAYKSFFPKSKIIVNREEARSKIEFYKSHDQYVHKLKPGESKYEDGKIKYRLKFPEFGSKVSYCEESELDTKIQQFIDSQSEMQSTRYLSIANAITSIKDGGEDISVLLDLVNNNQRNFLQTEFGRYLGDDWEFKADDGANSIGLFVFKKGSKCEIVVLSSEILREQQNLGKGTSLLGKTDSDKNIDSRKILPALAGNMEMIKAMIYTSLHPEVFSEFKISEIRAVNPWLGISLSALNSDLLYAYDLLLRKNKISGLGKVNQNLFLDDRIALVEAAKERVEGLENIIEDGGSTYNPYSAEWFQSKIDLFEKRYSKNMDLRSGYKDTPEWNAYVKLREGWNICKGFKSHVETNKGDYINGRVFELNGLLLSSPQFSSSANIRELGQAIDEYAKEVRLQVYKIGAPIQMAFLEFYKEHGTGAKAFDILFADKETLKLKDPNSREFDGDPVARKTLNLFLRTMAQLRHPEYKTDEDFEKAKEDEDYYYIPLLEAVSSRQIKNLGLWQTVKNKFKQYKTLTQGLFMGEEIEGGMSTYISENQELYNKLKYSNMLDRENRLNNEYGGSGLFETDLELVMNASLVAFCRSNVSKNYIPAIAGLKMALEAAEASGTTKHTANMENILKRFDDVVKSKFYGESIVPKQLQPLLRWINVVKYGFTKLTLSLNSRSFLRESLQGIYTGLARAGVNMYPGINKKYYTEGLTYVIQEASKNFSGVSMLQQMNSIYGMANQSLSQLAGQRRVNWAHINHWSQDTLFLTATAPDFMHRMSLLIAKMKSDGCFDAHSLDENGVLKYDFKKDGRFQHLINNDTSAPEYLKEKSLYLAMMDDFKRAGFKNPDGSELNAENLDALPQAYTRQEAQSIKNYADYLYGHYDEESKSLLYDSFVGSIFLQYKTFLTSRLEQWTMHEGVYNTAELIQQFDDNNNPLYVRFYEDEDGTAHKEILLENEYNELSDDEKSKTSLYYDYTGLPMQGMLQESFKVYKSLLSFNSETIKEVWSDPTTRAMFKLQIHDLWFMAMMTLIVNWIAAGIFDVDKPTDYAAVRRAAKKTGPLESFAYDIITGSMADSQLPNILNSFTDKPPVVSALERFATSSWKVITGDQNLAYWTTRNVGALRDFEGLVTRVTDK